MFKLALTPETTAIESMVRLRSLSCRISYGLSPPGMPVLEVPFRSTSRSAPGYGSGFQRTPCITVKVVTDVPIPSPSVSTTTKTKPRVRLSDRRASFSILSALTGGFENRLASRHANCLEVFAGEKARAIGEVPYARPMRCAGIDDWRPVQRDRGNVLELLEEWLVFP